MAQDRAEDPAAGVFPPDLDIEMVAGEIVPRGRKPAREEPPADAE